ncbi:MAG: TIGR04283 family arsenosugar biosynthesis glycosyltransferase [Candidatus Tectomicrobia bacterium]
MVSLGKETDGAEALQSSLPTWVGGVMISVIIPVYDEEVVLPTTLDHVNHQAGEFEIIVVDGGSHDRTCDIVSRYPEVQLLHAAKGRASQMNAGAGVARGEWLLFLHADTLLPPQALSTLNALEADQTYQTGGFRQRFSGDDWRLRLISFLHNFRCQRTRIMYGDQALFVRQALFNRLHGFPDQPILEDVAFGEKLLLITRPVLLDDYVITDSRKFEKIGIWRSFARVLAILIRHRLGLSVAPSHPFFKDIR